MPHPDTRPTVTGLRVASAAGSLPARIIRPAAPSSLPPLVVLHGISRNAGALATLFTPWAARSGRMVIVPRFSETRWPHFQRPCRAARPDQALLALLAHLAATDPACAGPVDLFGHSGGAQLAHRFAMLYPHTVGRLNLVAAGWYCLPDASMSYPYGLGTDAARDSLSWVRRSRQGLPAFLRLPVRVFVGTADRDRDPALRTSPALDRGQGPDRIARAETYVARFRSAAQSHGIAPDIALTRLAGIAHDVGQALRRSDLAARVTGDGPDLPRLSVAI